MTDKNSSTPGGRGAGGEGDRSAIGSSSGVQGRATGGQVELQEVKDQPGAANSGQPLNGLQSPRARGGNGQITPRGLVPHDNQSSPSRVSASPRDHASGELMTNLQAVDAKAQRENDEKLTCKEKMALNCCKCTIKSANFKCHGKNLDYDIRSLFCIPGNFFLRKWLVWLTEWKWFENFITLVILANSVMLAFTDYGERLHGSEYVSVRNANIQEVDTVFSIIFTFECVAKILSMGFILHRKSYLRDVWNWLDFFVVSISVIGWLPGIESNSSLKSLRTFRILRPLRSINSMPRMKALIKTLLASLVGLVNVGLFLAFVFTIFAIFGTHQFCGTQYQRCRLTEAPINMTDDPTQLYWPINYDMPWLCSTDADCGRFLQEGDVQKCGNLLEHNIPIERDKPDEQDLISFNIIGFNSVPQGLFTIFQALTLEGWTGMMYNYMDSNSPTISITFFCMLVVFGSFFAMQLVLAQIMDSFARQQQEKAEAEQAEVEKDEKAEELAQLFLQAAGPSSREIHEEELSEVSLSDRQVTGNRDEEEKQKEDASPSKKRIIKGNAHITKHLQRAPTDVEGNGGVKNTLSVDEMSEYKGSRGNGEGTDGSKHNTADDAQKASHKNAIMQDPDAVVGDGRLTPEDKDQGELDSLQDEDDEYEDEDANDIAARLRSKQNCFYRSIYLFVTHPVYNFIVFVLILVNTVVLAIDDFPQTLRKERILGYFNDFFTWAFFAEMLMKMMGLGVKNYVRDSFNLFDAIVVLLSLVDVTISAALTQEQIGSLSQAFQALRALRLLRVIKLARSWTKLQDILSKTVKSLKDISNFSVLLGLFMYIYALLGMEMFANNVRYTLDDDVIYDVPKAMKSDEIIISPRMSFDDINKALTTIFCEIMGEDWNVYMYTYVRPQKGYMRYMVMGYFLSIMVIGNIMLLSLFTAILLQNFEDSDDDEEDDEKEKFSIKKIFTKKYLEEMKDVFLGIFGAKKKRANQKGQKKKDENQLDISASEIIAASPQSGLDKPNNGNQQNNSIDDKDIGKVGLPGIVEEDAEIDNEQQIGSDILPPIKGADLGADLNFKENPNDISMVSAASGGSASARKKKMQKSKSISLMHYENLNKSEKTIQGMDSLLKDRLQFKSLCIFGPDNRIRIFANMIYTHPFFDRFILTLIGISTLTLAFETPLDNPKGFKVTILTYIDYVMSSFFFCECITKVIALGFIACGSKSYIRNPWNILDFVIVLSALLSMIFVNVDLKAIKSLRILRVLRPLRIVAKNRGLKLAITSLFNSLPNIVNLLLIVVFFIFLLSILCMTLFSGQFYQCSTDHLQLSYHQQNDLINTMQECLNYGGEWVNQDFHFDTTGDAMITLLSIQTTEGWIDVMWSMVDSVGQYQQPQYYANMFYVIFCMAIMVFITLLFLNLFVGVVIETFNKEKEALSLNSLLRSIERKWIDVQIMTYQAKPQLKINTTGFAFRDFMIKIATSEKFDSFIMFMILGNTFVLMLKWYAMSEFASQTTGVFNIIFSIIFTIEAIIKLIAMRWNYFKEAWNQFDFIVVVGTWLVIGVMELKMPIDLTILGTILRTLRIGRVFRIVKRAPSIQIIFQTLIEALPAIASLGLLLALLFFMYSVIGIGQFGAVTLQENLDYHTNFQNIYNAFLLLMRCSTGEGWNAVMMDANRGRQILFQCNPTADYYSIKANGMQPDGCGNKNAVPYFYSFTLIVSQIFLNLFIAIIIDSFLNQSDAFSLPVTQNDIDEFIEVWASFDPDAKGFIESHELEDFLQMLCKTECGLIPNRKLVDRDVTVRRRFIARLEIPCFNGFRRFMFYDVLQTMARTVCEKAYNKERISKKKVALKHLKIMGTHTADKLEAGVKGIFGKEFELDFEDVLNNIGNLDKNIDSVSVLTQIARNMSKKSKAQGNILDVNEDMTDEVYTSKHFVYGSLIVQCWRQFINIKEEEQKMVDEEPDLQVANYSLQINPGSLGAPYSNVMQRMTPGSTTVKTLSQERQRFQRAQENEDAEAVQVDEEDLEELGVSQQQPN